MSIIEAKMKAGVFEGLDVLLVLTNNPHATTKPAQKPKVIICCSDEASLKKMEELVISQQLAPAIQKVIEENQITDPRSIETLSRLLRVDISQNLTGSQSETMLSWHTGDKLEFGAETGQQILYSSFILKENSNGSVR
jgi:hypothetical protein